MNLFFSINEVQDLHQLLAQAMDLKKNPLSHNQLGKNKTLGLVFLNPSLRTRLSTQKAAMNLGINTMVMNMNQEGWALETQDGVVMNGHTAEHISEAAAVMGQYCDILGLRSFPKLQNREEDYSEDLFNKFVQFCGVPVISLESATRHPLQSLADLITIQEYKTSPKPRVVLTWAPHVKALPQAVPNSFAEWMAKSQEEGLVDFIITHPQGYELADNFTNQVEVTYDQSKALQQADFVYVKNWSSYHEYGQILSNDIGWMLNKTKLAHTNQAKVMHCLPVRRDLELSSDILDDKSHSLVIPQAANRVWAAQAVLKEILHTLT